MTPPVTRYTVMISGKPAHASLSADPAGEWLKAEDVARAFERERDELQGKCLAERTRQVDLRLQLQAQRETIARLEGALREAHDVLHDGRAFYPLHALGILKRALAIEAIHNEQA